MIFSTEDFEALVATPRKGMSKRQQICIELLQTEKNYYEILKTITAVSGCYCAFNRCVLLQLLAPFYSVMT